MILSSYSYTENFHINYYGEKKSFVIVENGKNYSANESNTFFELFIYLKKYNN